MTDVRQLLDRQRNIAAPQVAALIADHNTDAGYLIEYASRWGAALGAVLDELDELDKLDLFAATVFRLRRIITTALEAS